jgi:hypothetical protein
MSHKEKKWEMPCFDFKGPREKERERERERWSFIGAAFLHATQINDFIAPNQNPKIVFLV